MTDSGQNLRSLCVLKQDLTFQSDQMWTASLHRSATWNSDDLSNSWSVFALQEAFRLCIYALLLIDTQMAAPCNTRPLLSISEVIWDIPPPNQIWDASSADEWVLLVLEEVQKGSISTSMTPAYLLRAENLLHPTQIIQSLMGGAASSRLLNHLSACPLATLCVLAALDSLVRDFTYCYYQMPPVLPDPSAYHVLSPAQNRPINAAISTILDTVAKDTVTGTQLNRLIHLMAWTVRLGLSEPDDLLVAGIAETSLTAGLATTAHCILGSAVAKRRGAVSGRRRYGENYSTTAWEDLLRSVTLVSESIGDPSCHQAPWMTALSYRVLLLLWRTLRRAIAELENTSSSTGSAGSFSPAGTITSLVCEQVRNHLNDENLKPDPHDLRGIETGFILLLAQVFGTVTDPVGMAIINILREIRDMLDIPQLSYIGGLD